MSNVRCQFSRPDGAPVKGVVEAHLQRYDYQPNTLIVPEPIFSGLVNSAATLTLTKGTYLFRLLSDAGREVWRGIGTVPAAGLVELEDIVTQTIFTEDEYDRSVGAVAAKIASDPDLLTSISSGLTFDGVKKFNGRSGLVVPANGDYNAAMVGAEPAGAILAHTQAADPHTQYIDTTELAQALTSKADSTALASKVDNSDSRLSDARVPLAHTHATSQVTGLSTALAAKVDNSDSRLSDARAPLAHTHTTAQVTGLDTALAGKAASGHTHTVTDIGGLSSALSSKVDTTDTRLSDRRSADRLLDIPINTTAPTDGQIPVYRVGTNKVIWETNAGSGSSGVASFNGRSGAVLPVANDYTVTDIGGLSSALSAKVDTTDIRLSDARTPTTHGHPWSAITATPTTVAGYGITDAAASGHTHTFSVITGKPTTLAGYGITDAAAASHSHTFAAITAKPTTVSGYGITDAVATNDSRLSDSRTPTSHNQAWSTITATPTTLTGYGITDAFKPTGTPTDGQVPVWSTSTSSVIWGTVSGGGTAGVSSFKGRTGAVVPVANDYAVSDITGLSTALTGKVDTTDSRLSDSRTPTSHNQAWSTITATPTTLSGYGITDAASASHSHTFAALTSKPTTLSGYGITDSVKVTGTPTNGQVPSWDTATGNAIWTTPASGGGGSSGVSSFKGRTGTVVPVADDYNIGHITGLQTELDRLQGQRNGDLAYFTSYANLRGFDSQYYIYPTWNYADNSPSSPYGINNATGSNYVWEILRRLRGISGETQWDTYPAKPLKALATDVVANTTAIASKVDTTDSRLSDARTPTTHNHTWSAITATPTTLSGYGITDSVKVSGTPGNGQVPAWNTAAGNAVWTTPTSGGSSFTYTGNTVPSSPATGETWYEPATNAIWEWNGTLWLGMAMTLPLLCRIQTGAVTVNNIPAGYIAGTSGFYLEQIRTRYQVLTANTATAFHTVAVAYYNMAATGGTFITLSTFSTTNLAASVPTWRSDTINQALSWDNFNSFRVSTSVTGTPSPLNFASYAVVYGYR